MVVHAGRCLAATSAIAGSIMVLARLCVRLGGGLVRWAGRWGCVLGWAAGLRVRLSSASCITGLPGLHAALDDVLGRNMAAFKSG